MSRKTTLSTQPLPSPLPPGTPSLAEILAASPPPPKRRAKRQSAKSLGADPGEGDILDQYLREVSRTPLLNAKQELLIAFRVQAGDEEALSELVTRNLRFVISVAKKYQNRGLSLPDLIGEGNIGLMTAARKFDPNQGVKFISYAVWWIRQSILASLAKNSRTVRIPLNRTADLARVVRTIESLRRDLGRTPTTEEVANATELSVDVVRSLESLNTAEVRLDAPLDPSGERSLMDRFLADEGQDVEAEVMARMLSEEVAKALRTLPPRDARVISLYFGLEEGEDHTLEEIGDMLGITRERVRQIRDRALRKLKEGKVGEALGSYAGR